MVLKMKVVIKSLAKGGDDNNERINKGKTGSAMSDEGKGCNEHLKMEMER